MAKQAISFSARSMSNLLENKHFLCQIFSKNPTISVMLLFSFLFSQRGKTILWKKRNDWKRFKPPRLQSFHFCFCDGYNRRSGEHLAVMSVQRTEFSRALQSQSHARFGGLVLPLRPATWMFRFHHSTPFPYKCW